MLVDVVMLAGSRTPELIEMTQTALKTLHASEPGIQFRVVLVESFSKTHVYDGVTDTLRPGEPFNFHRFLNLGFELTSGAEYVCFVCNDLVFEPGWFTELLKAEREWATTCVLGPMDPSLTYVDIAESNFLAAFSGHCFVLRRDLHQRIGKFDEQFPGYWADDDYVMTLRQMGIPYAAIRSSRVLHLKNRTVLTQSKEEQARFFSGKAVFKQKWGCDRA